MDEIADRIVEVVGYHLPRLIAGVAVLLAGWLLALALAALVRKALRRTTVDNRIARWLATDMRSGEIAVEASLARLVFWLLMLFAFVAFFQVLGLTLVTEPLNGFLTEVVGFLPRIVSAGLLLLLAWILATALRFSVRRGLGALRLDERLEEEVREGAPETGVPPRRPLPLSTTLAETTYWLVFLLFLPAILDVLSLDGLMGPIVGLLQETLAFLPNVLAALLILAVGWFLARVVRRIVTNLLASAGADRIGERAEIDHILGQHRVSDLVGLVLYVLILIPVLIAALNALELDALTRPASEMLYQILAALPDMFAAAIVLVFAVVGGRIAARLVAELLRTAGFDNLITRFGVPPRRLENRRAPSEIAGTLVFVALMLFAMIEALGLLHFDRLAELLTGFTVFLGKVLLGLVVFGLGLYLANLAARTIRASGVEQAGPLAIAARVAILTLAGAMALQQMDLADAVIDLAFGLVLGAVAVAAAIAFGIGGKELAAEYLQRWTRGELHEPASGAGVPPAPGPPHGRVRP